MGCSRDLEMGFHVWIYSFVSKFPSDPFLILVSPALWAGSCILTGCLIKWLRLMLEEIGHTDHPISGRCFGEAPSFQMQPPLDGARTPKRLPLRQYPDSEFGTVLASHC